MPAASLVARIRGRSELGKQLVPGVGLEPTRAFTHRCLRRLRSVRRCSPVSPVRAQSGALREAPSVGVATSRCYQNRWRWGGQTGPQLSRSRRSANGPGNQCQLSTRLRRTQARHDQSHDRPQRSRDDADSDRGRAINLGHCLVACSHVREVRRVDVTPAPSLPRLGGSNDRVSRVLEVAACVATGRGVAAEDGSAAETPPKVHPGRAFRIAWRTPRGPRTRVRGLLGPMAT